MKIGSQPTPELRSFQRHLRLKDLTDRWVIRIVNGPFRRLFHMWPTYDEDKQTGVQKSTWKSVMVDDKTSNLLVKMAEVDKTLKQKWAVLNKQDPKTVRSNLRKSDRFDYAIIRRNTGKPPAVEIFEANWTVHQAIMAIKEKKDPTSAGQEFLMYGLPYMYDLVIERKVNAKTNRADYEVDVVISSLTTSGKIHMKHLDELHSPYPDKAAFFSAEDLEVINSCAWELEDQDPPVSPEEVAKVLMQYPIDLGARSHDNPNVFMFFNGAEDLKACKTCQRIREFRFTCLINQT